MILPMRDPTAAAAAAAAATATVMASTSSSSGASSSSSSSHSSSASHLNNILPPTIHPQLAEMLSKEHELFMKRAHFFKNHFRYPMQQSNATGDVVLNTPTPPQQQQQQQAQTHKTSISHNSMSDMDMVTIKRHKFDITDSFKMSGGHCNSDEIEVTAVKHGIPSPMIKAIPESMLLEPIEEETKCVVCNANFPSVWLLEQHAALQHSTGSSDEKPFICEQCGQSYRYRSAYVKHKEQNHRARLPADKLFTCDVCGMQFRYLKSFKKHRLNHALERLHGKRDKKNSMESSSADGIVTSTNESHVDDEGNSMHLKHEEDGDEEQDNTVDSATHEHPSINVVEEIQAKISSSAENEVSTPPPQQQHPHQHQPSAILPLRTSQLMSPTMHLAGNSMVKVSLPECSISGMKSNSDWWEQQSARFLAASHGGDPNEQMPTTSVNSLINAEHIPSDRALGLNPQEASILNFLRVDAAERQRDRRFACPFCGKCVRSKENLKLHVRKHTGERPFVCLFCGRAFGGKSDLTRHLRIHTGERPYHCESCGKCFARADYLSKHLTTHVHNTANAAPR